MLKILVTNDDGVHAPGIKVLAAELATIAEVTVVAPDRDRSAASHSLTIYNPLRPRTLENGFISVDGTPTDCVHLALTGLLDFKVDMVVSGINAGENLGDDILYSGTVAAAMEGRYLGYPSMAVSLVGGEQHYATAAYYARELVRKISCGIVDPNLVLNVNVPDLPLDKIQGTAVVKSGLRHFSKSMVKSCDPRGRTIYWIGNAGSKRDQVDSDFNAIEDAKVSITPLSSDMTNHAALAQLKNHLCELAVSDV